MKRIRDRIPQELVTVPLCSIIAAAGGFVLSSGTVSGTASTLAAAVAGICHPLYAMALLLGGLAAYAANDAAPGMRSGTASPARCSERHSGRMCSRS